MKNALAISCCLVALLAPVAIAQPLPRPRPLEITKPKQLIVLWINANDDCRGGLPENPLTEAGCADREVYDNKLDGLGWCYGKEGEYGYQHKWHRCVSNSIRLEEEECHL